MRHYRETVRVALPAVTENLLNSAIILVDALMVASLGSASLAAAGLAGVLTWRLRSLASVLQIGFGATVARRWGEANFSAARALTTHSLVLGLVIGTLAMAIIPFSWALFHVLSAGDTEVGPLAGTYFAIVVAGFPFRVASVHLAACLRAAGDTRTPLINTLIANLVNLFLNWVLIFGNLGAPALGLAGAGIATAIAFAVECGLYVVILSRGISQKRLFAAKGKDDAAITAPPILRLKRKALRLWIPGRSRGVVRIATPTFLEEIAISVGFIGFIAMIAALGKDALAAHTAVARIEGFSFNIGVGLGIAAATLVGQSLGARAFGDARRFLAVSLTTAMGSMGAVGILFALHPEWFLQWFGTSSEATFLVMGTTILLLAAVEQPFIASGMVLASGLRGAGYTLPPFISQMAGTVVVRIGLGYYFGFVLGWGLEGIYIATIADWVLRTIFLGWIASRGRWLHARA